ncbi:hypothetical protein AIT61_20945 [Salmonella enterica subsp. salamae]|uniref:hypothetical protein n=1 Tax=Salmonella enterica TaxID=28901 RepID=UPI0009A9B5A6|nr:hypothetical protein [Salmonella enterica]EBP3974854.1 hypothetical protein [Salmonella enterica subsp. enterica]ECC1558760.1 hypothetical protein [Salmonella enterica subsp. salamae]EAA9515292.1 hypothetical protein [Salmonella enterica]EAT0101382.1 hypothetical protein [Salmonella enterica]EBP6684673.1 hypothetical protein [Salmonella enterica subsp. enterica]
MRLFLLFILSLPFFFTVVHRPKGNRLEEINVNEFKPDENKKHYIFSAQEKAELITGINLWIDLIATESPVITPELISFFDEIRETYPKNGPANGISAEKITKWGRIYFSLRLGTNVKGKNTGGISINETAPNMVLINFNQDNLTKELKLQLIRKHRRIDNYCYKPEEDGTCIPPHTSIHYEYKYQSLKHPKLLITFGMESEVEKYNEPGMYPKNFTSIIIKTKPYQ